VIDQLDIGSIPLNLLQQRLNELKKVVYLLKLASRILIHLPVACQNVQLFQQLHRLAGFYFVHNIFAKRKLK
jgi:hypothetical protein